MMVQYNRTLIIGLHNSQNCFLLCFVLFWGDGGASKPWVRVSVSVEC